jgi:hypothetical protein
MSSLIKKTVAAVVCVLAGLALADSSKAEPSRSTPARTPQIIEVWAPGCGMVPVFAGPKPALNLDPSAGQSDPAAFDRLSGLPMGGAWCFN